MKRHGDLAQYFLNFFLLPTYLIKKTPMPPDTKNKNQPKADTFLTLIFKIFRQLLSMHEA